MNAAFIRTSLALIAALSVVAIGGRTATARLAAEGERFLAQAVNTDTGGTAQVEIAVERWSTEEQRNGLVATLREKGPDKLLAELQRLPRVGFIRQTSNIGWDLHYAHHEPLPEGGERVVVATDRPIGTGEAFNQPRTIDYPFTVVELRLNADGEGEGKMTYATKITAAGNSIILENWGIGPVLLQGVRRRSK